MRPRKVILYISILISFLLSSIEVSAIVSPEQKVLLSSAMAKIIPNFNIEDATVEGVSDNLYKIIANKDAQVFYLSNDGRYFFYGDLIDLNETNKNNWNVTDMSQRSIRKMALDKFSKKDMIVFKPKRGSTGLRKSIGVLTVFTDVDCPYGSKLHKEVEKAVEAGVEVRYFMFPRAGVGSNSYNKAVSIWCSKNHSKAFAMATSGEEVPSATCDNPIESQFNMGVKIGINATPSIVLQDGRVVPGYMTSDALIKLVKDGDARSRS
jgi:thiol:disulfide interchange protein DsbC